MLVDQPTVADTISILRGLKERYEVHHGVRIADSALVAAAMLSSRYITDRFLPDKAIDLVDESAARLKMEITSKPEQIDEIDRKILQLEMEKLSLGRESDTASQERLLRIERELAELGEQQRALNAQWQEERGRSMNCRRSRKRSNGCNCRWSRRSAITTSTRRLNSNTAPGHTATAAADEGIRAGG